MRVVYGVAEDELERAIVQLRKGGTLVIHDVHGKDVTIRVKPIEEFRCGSNTKATA